MVCLCGWREEGRERKSHDNGTAIWWWRSSGVRFSLMLLVHKDVAWKLGEGVNLGHV